MQLLGDTHGGLIHLFERDCSLQRRHQKVVERAPAPYLSDAQRSEVCDLAVRIGREARYTHAGTVEFLQDTRSGAWYFIEVNPRIQVEHTVTEVATGVDLVHAQLRITEGHAIGGVDSGIPSQDAVRLHRHAIHDLRYYLRLAEDLEASGAHAIAIKDMAGLCKPQAAATLVSALREHVGLPIHFHTHDTSGICAERAAVVSRLCVGAGDTVEAGALLLELAAVDASASAAEVAP